MKRLGMIAFILALVLCFAMPASAIKILPYSVPLQDMMRWDKAEEVLKLSNNEGESISVAWPSTVDLWNYDGDYWAWDLPTGDEFSFKKAVNVGYLGAVITYTEGEPIVEIWGTCASVSGTVNAMPVYVMSILTGEGAVGRAAEFVLAPTARMGGWGNAVKALLDLSGNLGSQGLLAGLCAEVVTPAGALQGSVACVEHEIVATAGYTAGDHIGSANTMNFMQFALSGDGSAVTEVDNHGQFMIVNGLTPLTGNLLSENYVTLKSAVNNLRKYLVLSTEENMLEFTTTLTDEDTQIETGGSNIDVVLDVNGVSTGPISGNKFYIELADGGTLNPTSGIYPLDVGIVDQGTNTVTGAHIIFGMNMLGIITNADYGSFCPFYIGTANRAITAIFKIASGPSIGNVNAAGEGTPVGYVPLFVDAGGSVRYIRTYSDLP